MRSAQDLWFHAKRHARELVEDQWFDRTRHVHTSGDVPLRLAGIADAEKADSELYVPARPANIREALRAVPVRDLSEYTFIDFGSGKGRAIFVAAEMPFQRVIGVEFSARLHEQSSRNAQSYRFRGKTGSHVTPLHQNAMRFEFPQDPLVIYMFNPFGRATMQVVLDRLDASLQQHPRHVVVVLLWPRCGDQVAQVRGMQQVCATRRHEIFEAFAPHT
ncbi:class I SAM-dependent methyltransferase [Terriglobus aquaticus]|uniref:Class I SAM-dependent methyltransferase n=1 Tax=Terriglobus aquaticus TaxID=940139 RepID=A0ABW9KPF2_9BACT|nr:class I SAM-dependent methyltransferase [Terriglobus aquaticus]